MCARPFNDYYCITGLMQKNGALVEANTYDTYGRVSPWSYHPCDVWAVYREQFGLHA